MTELLFKDGHTEKVSGEIKTGNVAFDSATMIPIVVRVNLVCDNYSSQWNCWGTLNYNGITIARVESNPRTGSALRTKGVFDGDVYLPSKFDNFEKLNQISNFTYSHSYNDNVWGSVKVLQWIDRK